ncbi:hypothetical protein OESDEN_00983, partial [Oesophagostomum dentatum]
LELTTSKKFVCRRPILQKSSKPVEEPKRDDDNSIDDVDEDKIDEILRDATRNLVIFFYDGRAQCPSCGEALSEVEEIDDDIEATGYVQACISAACSLKASFFPPKKFEVKVVKTDDRSVARDLGIVTFPSLVYYRRKNPILYDGKH